MVNVPGIVALSLVGVAALLNVVSLATTHWVKAEVSGDDVHEGLWRGCLKDTCSSIDSAAVNSKLEAARGLTIIAFLMAVGSGVLLGFSQELRTETASQRLPLIAMGLLLLQAILLSGGTVIGWRYFDDKNSLFDPDYSLVLAAVASVMYYIAAFLAGVSTQVGITTEAIVLTNFIKDGKEYQMK